MTDDAKADTARLAVDARNALVDVVAELTAPRLAANWQGKQLVHRTDPPLLEQLHQAVGSNVGGAQTVPGKQKWELTPLDFGALELHGQIDERVRSWLDELGARPGKSVTTSQALTSWLTLWCATAREVADHDRRRRVAEGWVQAIRDKLDPPDRIEITEPCPVCGHEFVTPGLLPGENPADGERVAALNAIGRERSSESHALCSSCSTVWMGGEQMKALALQIDVVGRARCSSRLAGVSCELTRHKRDRHEAVFPWGRQVWRSSEADEVEAS